MRGATWTLVALSSACQEYNVRRQDFTEQFVQEVVERRVDLVVVVDDSPSMAEEQERLGAEIGALVDVLLETETDFQVAVTTTDLSQGAALRGGVLTAALPGFEDRLREALLPGDGGSRTEQGLAAVSAVLDRFPEVHRPSVDLHALVVSDEDDASPEEPATYLRAVSDVLQGASLVVHGIVGDLPSGCATGSSAASPAPRYAEVVAATGGQAESICAEHFAAVLAAVGLDAAGLPDTFPLGRVPEPDSLEVWVDDVRLPQRDVDGWVYRPADNAIVFSGRAIPLPGMRIGVLYQELQGVD